MEMKVGLGCSYFCISGFEGIFSGYLRQARRNQGGGGSWTPPTDSCQTVVYFIDKSIPAEKEYNWQPPTPPLPNKNFVTSDGDVRYKFIPNKFIPHTFIQNTIALSSKMVLKLQLLVVILSALVIANLGSAFAATKKLKSSALIYKGDNRLFSLQFENFYFQILTILLFLIFKANF